MSKQQTFFEISEIPPHLQERYWEIINERISKMKQSMLDSVCTFIELYDNSENRFSFEHEIYNGFDKLGTFWFSIDVELPFEMKVRLNQIISDFTLVAMSLTNAIRCFPEPRETEGEQQ